MRWPVIVIHACRDLLMQAERDKIKQDLAKLHAIADKILEDTDETSKIRQELDDVLLVQRVTAISLLLSSGYDLAEYFHWFGL